MIVLAMLTALGRTHEVETHTRGALNNGAGQAAEITGRSGSTVTLIGTSTNLVVSGLMEDAGYEVTLKLVKSRDVYAPEMQKGNVDVSADYLSSMTEFLNRDINGPEAPPVATPG